MIQTILTMYIIHIAGMVLYVGKEFYVIQILELFYVEIIIFPVIFDGQTPLGAGNGIRKEPGLYHRRKGLPDGLCSTVDANDHVRQYVRQYI